MSNKEKYKKAFSVLQTSGDFQLEEGKMAILKKKATFRSLAAAAAAAVVIVAGTGTAYAANVGGIQRTIQLWIHGDQTSVTIDFDGMGNYTMEYLDENGKLHESGGGGVAIEADGTERPLTAEELMLEMANEVNVEYGEDGTALLYFQDQVVDITDKFENGYCYIHLNGKDSGLYVTVKYQDGWATSSYKYPTDL